MRFGIKFQIGRKDIVIDAEIEKARIEYEKGQESLWSKFWNHDRETVEALAGYLQDTFEDIAAAEDIPDWIRDIYRGASGDNSKSNPATWLGSFCRGVGVTGLHLSEGLMDGIEHPYDSLKETAEAGAYAVENIKKAPDFVKIWWKDYQKKSINEKITEGVEIGINAILLYETAKDIAKNAKKIKNTLKERKVLRNASKLTVEGTEAVTEEASVVSEIDKLDDAMEKLKKWEKSDVVELEIMETGETGNGASKSGSGSVIKNIKSKSPQQLIADGWEEVTNPKMAANTTSREFYDPKSGLKIRFDKGVDGANGFEAVDHYHVMNPNYTNKKLIIIWI